MYQPSKINPSLVGSLGSVTTPFKGTITGSIKDPPLVLNVIVNMVIEDGKELLVVNDVVSLLGVELTTLETILSLLLTIELISELSLDIEVVVLVGGELEELEILVEKQLDKTKTLSAQTRIGKDLFM